MQNIEEIKKQWKRLGCRFAVETAAEEVDVELLIVQTTHAGREEPVLLWAMLAWIEQYADIVNVARLMRKLPLADRAVLGAVCDIALANSADRKLRHVAARCTACDPPQILFHVMACTEAARQQEHNNSLPLFSTWGLLCSTITVKEDMLLSRQRVLMQNRRLSLRALFGANARAEILYSLFKIKEAYINELARSIGLSYQPVHAEIESLARNNLISIRRIGRTKIASLAPHTFKALAAVIPE